MTYDMIINKERYKKWNGVDWDFIVKISAFIICVMFLIIGGIKAGTETYIRISESKAELAKAKVINDELDRLYKTGIDLGIQVLSEQDMKSKKEKYSGIEYYNQQQTILEAQGKIANKMCKVGSWVVAVVDGERLPLHISGYYGYQANTYEGVHFMVTEDEWQFLSSHQYYLLGGTH